MKGRAMSEKAANLYDRIGGEAAVSEVIDRFYERVLADPVLASFFRESSMDKIRCMQKEFFAKALDGPQIYTGMTLSHAHAGRGITIHHFSRFAEHLLETLRELGLSQRDIRDVMARIALYADDITGGSAISG